MHQDEWERKGMLKKALNYLEVILVAAWIILNIIFIIRCQTERFHETLYVYSNLLSTQHIFLVTMKRAVLTVALCAFGIACIFLYFISYETEEFLFYVIIFLFAAGYIIGIWDFNMVFYVGFNRALFWRVSGDINLILFVFSIYRALLHQFGFKRKSLLNTINWSMAFLFSIAAAVTNSGQSRIVLRIFFLATTVFFVVSFIFHSKIIQRNHRKLLFNIADNITLGIAYIVPCFILYITGRYKFDTLSRGYYVYLDFMPFVIFFYSICLFIRFFQYHRTGFIVGGDANRIINEMTKHKETITQLIISHCMPPMNNLDFYNRALMENKKDYDGEKEQFILNAIKHEIAGLKEYLNNISSYHYLFGQVIQTNKIKVNIAALFQTVIYMMKKDESENNCYIEWGNITDRDYVSGDSYLLIQADQTLLFALIGVSPDKSVRIRLVKNSKENIRVNFTCSLNQDKMHMARRIKRILSSPHLAQPIMKDEEIGLYIAKNYILNHTDYIECKISRNGSVRKIEIEYELSGWSEEKNVNLSSMYSKFVKTEELNRKKIILLSTMPEQIEMIKSYLIFEKYTVICFSTEEDALDYIETIKNIGLVIIGTIFFSRHVNSFCEKIREKYSLGQLPILIISRDRYKYVNSDLLKNVNDIITEPFEEIELLQKIQLLILLQTSAQETARAKLDFLQAQMDPHFIFNTLSTIMPLCLQQPMLAYNMLDDFSQYLRGRLYTEDLQESIPICKELDLIQAYLSIERVRFPEYIEYQINADVNEGLYILPLLIEPIVENSVKHGINGQEKLNIVINVVEEDDYLFVLVKDDGKGMTMEKLNEIRQRSKTSNASIGISNVRKRLSIYYNERLEIRSTINKGTEVSFRIPKYYE